MNQPPLFISEDVHQVLDRVVRHGHGRMSVGDLFSCWRPPAPPARGWSDKRLWQAIDDCENSGLITVKEGMYGQVLEVVEDVRS